MREPGLAADESPPDRTLSLGQREALRLSDAGFGYRRIGMVLGISRSAARDRVHRAKAQLARQEEQR